MNTSTQPAEGAGGSRSQAAGELTLGLLSGEGRKAYPIPCGSELARDGGLTADQSFADGHRSTVGAELAREGGLTADQSLADVHHSTVGAELNWSSNFGHFFRFSRR